MKKPQPNEWWQHVESGLRLYCIGWSDDGFPVMCKRDRMPYRAAYLWENYQHLPDCTGWDWEPPALITNCPDCGEFRKCPDCGEFHGHGHEDVCPMAWVTQDTVPPRHNVDHVQWSNWAPSEWVVAQGSWGDIRHGHSYKPGCPTLRVRCRRKDLPPVPHTPELIEVTMQHSKLIEVPDSVHDPLGWDHSAQPKRTTVRLFVPRRVLDQPSIDYPVRCCFTQNGIKDVATSVEVKHDGYRFFVEGD